MLMHTRGVLIMTPGRRRWCSPARAALEASGSVAAEDEVGIGGFERVMGPNGEAQYYASDLVDAYRIALRALPLHLRRAGRARAAPRSRRPIPPTARRPTSPYRRAATASHRRRDLRRRDQPGPQAAVRRCAPVMRARDRPGRRPTSSAGARGSAPRPRSCGTRTSAARRSA